MQDGETLEFATPDLNHGMQKEIAAALTLLQEWQYKIKGATPRFVVEQTALKLETIKRLHQEQCVHWARLNGSHAEVVNELESLKSSSKQEMELLQHRQQLALAAAKQRQPAIMAAGMPLKPPSAVPERADLEQQMTTPAATAMKSMSIKVRQQDACDASSSTETAPRELKVKLSSNAAAGTRVRIDVTNSTTAENEDVSSIEPTSAAAGCPQPITSIDVTL